LVAAGTFIGFGLIYFAIVIFTRNLLKRSSQTISREQNRVVKALQEGLGGIRDVLIDGTQEAYCNIYRNADLPLRRAMANVQIAGATPKYGIEGIGLVLISLLSYSLAGRDGGIISAIPLLGALALGAQRLLPTMQQSYASWSLIRGEQSSLSDILCFLDQP
jgi:ATP-binding cassette subfamily B protein